MSKRIYTIVLCKFNKFGEIIDQTDIGLEPMTHKEALTMKSKQTNPSEWVIKRFYNV